MGACPTHRRIKPHEASDHGSEENEWEQGLMFYEVNERLIRNNMIKNCIKIVDAITFL